MYCLIKHWQSPTQLQTRVGIPVNGGPKFLYHVKQHMSNSQRYLVVGLVGLGLLLTVTIRVSRVSAMVSVRFSGIWDRRLQVCPHVRRNIKCVSCIWQIGKWITYVLDLEQIFPHFACLCNRSADRCRMKLPSR